MRPLLRQFVNTFLVFQRDHIQSLFYSAELLILFVTRHMFQFDKTSFIYLLLFFFSMQYIDTTITVHLFVMCVLKSKKLKRAPSFQ